MCYAFVVWFEEFADVVFVVEAEFEDGIDAMRMEDVLEDELEEGPLLFELAPFSAIPSDPL